MVDGSDLMTDRQYTYHVNYRKKGQCLLNLNSSSGGKWRSWSWRGIQAKVTQDVSFISHVNGHFDPATDASKFRERFGCTDLELHDSVIVVTAPCTLQTIVSLVASTSRCFISELSLSLFGLFQTWQQPYADYLVRISYIAFFEGALPWRASIELSLMHPPFIILVRSQWCELVHLNS